MATREDVRKLANASIARCDATGWFEELYQRAEGHWASIPWVNFTPNPHLLVWLDSSEAHASGTACLVVGCGLGDDAEALSAHGFNVVAFDISPTAIDGCRSRFPASRVVYVVADLLAMPPEWLGRFDLVLEANTLQVLPEDARAAAMGGLASVVALHGRLLVLCRARETAEPEGQFPWPLTREELGALCENGLSELAVESFFDHEAPPVRRFRALDELRGGPEGPHYTTLHDYTTLRGGPEGPHYTTTRHDARATRRAE